MIEEREKKEYIQDDNTEKQNQINEEEEQQISEALEEMKMEKAIIYRKQHLDKETLKKEEIKENERSLSLCKYYANELKCLDMEKYRWCKFEHDQNVKEARKI